MIRRPVRPSLTPIPRYTPLRPVGPAKLKRDTKYKAYLKSAAWRLLRKLVLARADGLCEQCRTPFGEGRKTVHHVTYIRLYHERLSDLLAVCDPCNRRYHGNALWRARHRRIKS